MKYKYLIKSAWQREDHTHGDMIEFLVSPADEPFFVPIARMEEYENSLNYEEVIRFPADHPKALALTSKLFPDGYFHGTPLWYTPIDIEEEFVFEDFMLEMFYVDIYGRELTCYTDRACMIR